MLWRQVPRSLPATFYNVGGLLTSTLGMDEAPSTTPLRLQVVDTIEIELMINSHLSVKLLHTDLSRPVAFYPLPVFRSPLGTRNTPRAFYTVPYSLISARGAVGTSQIETAFIRLAETYLQSAIDALWCLLATCCTNHVSDCDCWRSYF